MGSAPKQRISYFPLESMDDDMRKEMDRCRRSKAAADYWAKRRADHGSTRS